MARWDRGALRRGWLLGARWDRGARRRGWLLGARRGLWGRGVWEGAVGWSGWGSRRRRRRGEGRGNSLRSGGRRGRSLMSNLGCVSFGVCRWGNRRSR